MSTCLFTGEATGPNTIEEHTIPRGLCGRFRSRRSSASTFNNWCSRPFDSELVEAYSPLVMALAPLLSAEHQPGAVSVTSNDGHRLTLAPGVVPILKGNRVIERDPATGRPSVVLGEDRDHVQRFAAQLGWPADRVRVEMAPSTEESVLYRGVLGLSPAIEVAVLKSALLTFDHVFDQREDAFTRTPDLQWIREAVLRVVRDGDDAAALIAEASWGIDQEDLPDLRRIRELYGPPASSGFEHILLASATRGGSVDLYFLVAGVDVHRHRLCSRWSGSTFSWLCGAGMLAGDAPYGPIPVHHRLSFRRQTEARAVVPAGALATEEGRARLRIINEGVTAPRHLAVRRATSFVEHHADEFIKDQLLQLRVIGVAATIEAAVRLRLSRLYRTQDDDPEIGRAFEEIVEAHLAAVPAPLRGQDPDAADWQVWLPLHRAIVRALDVAIGFPRVITVQRTHVGIGDQSPPRRP